MPDLNVPGTYSTIRAAITASSTGDTIKIDSGSYSIASGGPPTFAYAALPNIFSISGFIPTTAWLAYDGVGNLGDASTTTITGNARLYVGAMDGSPPTQTSFTDLDFLYGSASGYILQTGQFGTTSGATTQTIFLDNLSFRGSHGGAIGAGSSNPSGNYGAVLGFRNLTFTNSTVALTGQSSFTGTVANSGGSSFLMVQGGLGGGSALISGNRFDESGYRNGLSIFDSQNVTLTNNTFARDTATTRFVRAGGNKISNSTNTNVSGNTFQDSSYLTIAGGSGVLTSNTFNGTNTATGSSGTIGIRLETGPGMPSYTYNSNTFYLVTPFVNTTTTAVTYTNATLQNTFLNPYASSNTPAPFRQYITGTNNSDNALTGLPDARDFISGQLGNDTLNGGAGSAVPANDIDFYMFNTTPNLTTNLDTILNYTTGATTDQIVLDRKVFTNIFTETQNLSGNVVAGLNGRGRVRPADVVARNGGVANAANQRIIVDANGSGPAGPGGVYYDVDGSGSTPAVPFAKVSTNNGTTWITTTAALGNILVI
jgi:hypothetical protein